MVNHGDIQHLLRLTDLAPGALEEILKTAREMKTRAGSGGAGEVASIAGRTIGMLFFRGSLRTRASFEAAVNQLGGHCVNLTAASDFWELESREGGVMDGPAPEHIKDAAAVLSRYVDAIAIRPRPAGRSWETDRQDASIREWADHAQVPVINMESALWHPLQALADLMTMRERLGELAGKRISLVWTRSPVPASPTVVHSTLFACLAQGMQVTIAHPAGYDLDGSLLNEARALAGGGTLTLTDDLEQAADGAHIVYGRSWSSLEVYGNETLAAHRLARTSGWMLDEALLSRGDDAALMHAMPVRRNLEASDEVLDGPRSLLYDQAENRLHTQQALLANLLGTRPGT
ncbi:MAG: N-acetylornithine carbamoyltransferase [Planctomycetota bacterium]|jgi:N-acetylornithine carbamoyltransferase|nr:acetylornithine carbamoyltransferase [Planctomycetota bacterium]MDP6519068.1 N-acetylornithine carbamoyltransferase [Planctomycetota bacterium]MDP6837731.1 N-acetylornithine carbamoyltransferase [Planctomycetota bacterium]MDP6956166.1 N-acetylornithine carbamoyltransferase [Planctomycetota bacterium]